VQEEVSLALSIKILSMAVLDKFWTLVGKFTVCDRLCVFNRVNLLFTIVFIYLSPHIKIPILDCTGTTGLFRNSLVSPEGALYKLNIIRLADLVSSWTALISNSFSFQ
jgi:hypothetical protein